MKSVQIVETLKKMTIFSDVQIVEKSVVQIARKKQVSLMELVQVVALIKCVVPTK